MKSPTEVLLISINRFLKRTGMPATTFGWMAIGDPNFVRNLREGREPRFQTLLRVKKFMSSYQQRETA